MDESLPNESQSSETKRTPPRERFAPEVVQFDLEREAEALAHESNEGHSGHRQIVLYKHGHASVSLFRFQQGGFMREHKASGTVFVQVNQGRIAITVNGEKHTLEAGGLLVLAPGVAHDVFAERDSVMLLTVCMDRSGT